MTITLSDCEIFHPQMALDKITENFQIYVIEFESMVEYQMLSQNQRMLYF